MTLNEKDGIRSNLKAYVEKYSSQNKAAESLKGTSAGTLSAILNGKYDNVSDEMFRKIASQIGGGSPMGWQVVRTANFGYITYALDDAQKWSNVTWVVGSAGCGKTTAARVYNRSHKEVFYVLCWRNMTRSEFVKEVAGRIGLRVQGLTNHGILTSIVDALVRMESPLFIIDEADKPGDNVMSFYIDLYNQLEERCGIVFLSTYYGKLRIHRGVGKKEGYDEMESRIGRKFYELDDTTAEDVYAICVANGLRDKEDIDKVILDSRICKDGSRAKASTGECRSFDYDLRRVKKGIHSSKRSKE